MTTASFLEDPDQFTASLQINLAKFERKWKIKEHEIDTLNDNHLIKFERGKHYIPTRISEFISADIPWIPHPSPNKSLLICADWSNPLSRWTAVVNALLTEPDHAELYCWIPAALYDVKLIGEQLEELIGAFENGFSTPTKVIKPIHDEIPYSAVLSLIRSADAVAKVPEDFVNRYIIYLAEQIGVKII